MKLIRTAALTAAALCLAGAANAGVSIGIGVAVPGVYVGPAPVYYAPPPPPPRVVYYQPAPVYYYDPYVYSRPVVVTKVKTKKHKVYYSYGY